MSYKVSVEFCMQWNYAPKAASFAEQLFNHFRSDVTSLDLIPSSGGAFEVIVNGTKLYSKLETGEFPDSEKLFTEFESLNR